MGALPACPGLNYRIPAIVQPSSFLGCCQWELFVCSRRINLKRRLLLLLMLIIKVDSTATEICPHRTAVIATNYHHSGWLDASLDEDDAWFFFSMMCCWWWYCYCSSVELFFFYYYSTAKKDVSNKMRYFVCLCSSSGATTFLLTDANVSPILSLSLILTSIISTTVVVTTRQSRLCSLCHLSDDRV